MHPDDLLQKLETTVDNNTIALSMGEGVCDMCTLKGSQASEGSLFEQLTEALPEVHQTAQVEESQNLDVTTPSNDKTQGPIV